MLFSPYSENPACSSSLFDSNSCDNFTSVLTTKVCLHKKYKSAILTNQITEFHLAVLMCSTVLPPICVLSP